MFIFLLDIYSNNKIKRTKGVPIYGTCEKVCYIADILDLINQPITVLQAKQIYAATNGDMNKIREKYGLSQSSNVTNLVGGSLKL